MYNFKNYDDDTFFNCKLRGANNVIAAVFGGSDKIDNIPPSVLERAAKRGKSVHEYIEYYLKHDMKEEPKIDLEYDIYWHFFKSWLNERTDIKNIIGVETKLISEKLACKGIIDFIGECKNKDDDKSYYALVDWKTSSNLDLFRTQCQLQIYYELLDDLYPDLAKQITELRTLNITKYEYRWYRFPIDRDLGKSILYLYDNFLRCDHE